MIEVTDWRTVTDGLRFPEGPVAMEDGSVLVVEIREGRVTRVAPDGAKTVVAETGGGPNGAAIGPDGALYVCNNGGFEWTDNGMWLIPGHQPADYIGGRIQRIDLATGTVTDLYTECDGFGLRGPNDIVFDDDGGFWFSDLGKTRARDKDHGGIYYAKADGSSIVAAAYPADNPNGVGLAPDGGTLYAADSPTGRLWAWEVVGPGRIQGTGGPIAPGGATLLSSPSTPRFFDSLAVDADGNICIATIPTGGITVISPTGEEVGFVPVPEFDPLVTNICFGGPDRRTAFITSSATGKLLSCTWPTAGKELAFSA